MQTSYLAIKAHTVQLVTPPVAAVVGVGVPECLGVVRIIYGWEIVGVETEICPTL